MTFDEMVAQAIRDTLEEQCAEYRTDGEQHRFSLAYKIGRAILIRFRGKYRPLSVRTIKLILNAAIALLFALVSFAVYRQFGL